MNAYCEHTKYTIVDENGKPTNEKFKTITILPTTTNGDVIKAMFPKAKIEDFGNDVMTVYFAEDERHEFWNDEQECWWNAPYKAESEDKE